MVVTPDFWRDKRVLVTGHTGFKGSWLSLWLQGMGAEVIGYALAPPTTPSLYEIGRVEEGMHSILADVRDEHALQQAFTRHEPDIVIHMAAQALVRASYDAPVETFDVNVMGTVRVLEAMRRSRSTKVGIVVTSDKCYENVEATYAYKESDKLGGHDPYSSSKGCAELVVSAYRRSFLEPRSVDEPGAALASVRAGNVIGGGDWSKDRLIADVVSAFSDNRRVAIRNPDAIRPWQHVLDPLAGYLALAEALWSDGAEFARAWNFGPSEDEVVPVGELVDRLATRWGGDASWVHDRGDHPHEARLLMLDATMARERLGWQPRLQLTETVAWIVDWHRAHVDGADMRMVTESQIARYAELEPA